MRRGNFLKITIVILVALNIGILAITWRSHFGRGNEGNKPLQAGPHQRLINEVGFNDDQAEEFMDLFFLHKERIEGIQESLHEKRESLFELLNTNNDSLKNRLLDEIVDLQKKNLSLLYLHFEEVSGICKNEKQKK